MKTSHLSCIGEPLDRVDGRLKVTGQAKYAAEFVRPRLAYGYVLQSAIARGRIISIDGSAALAMPGVLALITHENGMRLRKSEEEHHFAKPFVLQSPDIDHFGQRIGVIVAETFEQARDAAPHVKVTCQEDEPLVSFEGHIKNAFAPEKLLVESLKPETRRGDFERAFPEADVRLDVTYIVPNQHNNPMEPHATIAEWNGDRLTLYESTQGTNWVQEIVCDLFDLEPQAVRVISPFVGGGFGCKAPVWEHTMLAIMAAKHVGRPVKIVLARQQMFPGAGYRPLTQQHVQIGAKKDGGIVALGHAIITPTNITRQYLEHAGLNTPMMYSAPNLLVSHRGIALNWPRGTIMRAPGATPGMFALECAMDELAHELGMDPVELRQKNEPSRHPQSGLPWSSRNLTECYRKGAEKFGWSQRAPQPGRMRDGQHFVGMGVASASFDALQRPCSAHVRLYSDGRALVQLAASDIGTGTYTCLTQVAAAALELPERQITVEVGDSDFPETPGSGGSWGAASYGSAVHEACLDARRKLFALASRGEQSALRGLEMDDMRMQGGLIVDRNNPSRREKLDDVLRRHGFAEGLQGRSTVKPAEETKKYAKHTFGAHFAEVRVHPDTGEVRVSRFLAVFASGRILNAKTARSQISGGIVMGIGMALSEESVVDERYGQFVNGDLAGYHVAVNPDAPNIEVLFLEERDDRVNSLGVKGLGEVGLTGAAAAIANAVFHATGKRIRRLPITPDKVMG